MIKLVTLIIVSAISYSLGRSNGVIEGRLKEKSKKHKKLTDN